MKSRLGDRQRLIHIIESIEEIEQYIREVDFEFFIQNSMMKFASIKQIEIIGEAANHISDETKGKFSDIQWRQITSLRHVLVHEYFGIDHTLIWQIIRQDIPALKMRITEILSEIDNLPG